MRKEALISDIQAHCMPEFLSHKKAMIPITMSEIKAVVSSKSLSNGEAAMDTER